MIDWREQDMRGSDDQTAGLFSYVSCEARVPAYHPLRPIRAIVDEALEVLPRTSRGCIQRSAGRRSRRRSCCALCCCRPSTRSARSVSL
ncbi:hypothetical protein AGR5A_pb0067 [Agrobacterium genomosp. 5 str. CFBP 6626]|nr:hypothetical protein AGR5A_pb0067 [Agrobacterium genomosp. 5 str. CFBP 6626]